MKNKPGRISKLAPALLNIPALWQYALLLVLLSMTFLVYLPVRHYDFLNWDDDVYITTSDQVKDLSDKGIKQIFTRFSNSNYHPITTLSYALIYNNFGSGSKAFHLFNLFLHLINVLLVFLLLRLLFPQGFIALFGAVIHALHPMHIESVAWISETKDLLYTAFLLMSFVFYVKYKQHGSLGFVWYVISLLLFILSCLSKSAAAVFPLLLIAYDWFTSNSFKTKTLYDKAPYILLSIATGVLALLSQEAGQSINMVGEVSYFNRILFASFGLWFYAVKFVIPVKLSALHYFPDMTHTLPSIYFIALFCTLILMGYVIFKIIRQPSQAASKLRIFGLAFYIISLLMVLQLIPIGRAIVAERYTYLSYLGLSVVAGSWLLPYFSLSNKIRSFAGRSVQFGLLAFFVILTTTSIHRLPVWQNSITLFDDVIQKYPDRAYAYMARGNSYLNMKETGKALADYGRAIARDPEMGQAYYRRANLNYALGKYPEAIADIEKAVALMPGFAEAWNDRGSFKYLSSMYDEALKDFRQAIELKPGFHQAYKNAGLALYRLGSRNEALSYLNRSIEMLPDYAEGYYFRGIMQFEGKDLESACLDWVKANELGYQAAQDKLREHCSYVPQAKQASP